MHKNGSVSTNALKLKRGDIILIVIMCVIGFAAWGYIHFTKQTGYQVIITVDGKEYGCYSLKDNEVIPIESDLGKNTIVIKDGYVTMDDADCPDKICVRHKKINKVGETIVCLPHKVVVEVEASSSDQEEKEYDIITKNDNILTKMNKS